MEGTTALGLVAGGLTTAAFVPQVWKTWRSRSAGDVSLAMFVGLWVGVSLWVLYGLLIGSTPVVVANGVTLGLVSVMLVLKRRFQRTHRGGIPGTPKGPAAAGEWPLR